MFTLSRQKLVVFNADRTPCIVAGRCTLAAVRPAPVVTGWYPTQEVQW